MTKICCSALFRALIERHDGLEWTPVSEGNAAGPIVVGRMVSAVDLFIARHSAIYVHGRGRVRQPRDRFMPLFWCPYCGKNV